MTPGNRIVTLCAAAVLLLATPALAAAQQQTGRVQGLVTNQSTQQPLTGAQVSIPGTGLGIITNEQGRYLLLNVPVGEQMVRVQTIGYSSAEQTVTVTEGEIATADFVLSETAVALDEVVVTGTAATVRRKEIGNSIATIGATQIENMPVVNAGDVLAGRAPGVTFMANSGQPGAGSTIKIRGINSVSQDAQPLIYVDGVRIFNEPTRAGWGGRGLTTP
ncbi:MAG: carboxypeptidase-like regulatory domain-containing protein, partial [Longimicrobiales bacterium]